MSPDRESPERAPNEIGVIVFDLNVVDWCGFPIAFNRLQDDPLPVIGEITKKGTFVLLVVLWETRVILKKWRDNS